MEPASFVQAPFDNAPFLEPLLLKSLCSTPFVQAPFARALFLSRLIQVTLLKLPLLIPPFTRYTSPLFSLATWI